MTETGKRAAEGVRRASGLTNRALREEAGILAEGGTAADGVEAIGRRRTKQSMERIKEKHPVLPRGS